MDDAVVRAGMNASVESYMYKAQQSDDAGRRFNDRESGRSSGWSIAWSRLGRICDAMSRRAHGHSVKLGAGRRHRGWLYSIAHMYDGGRYARRHGHHKGSASGRRAEGRDSPVRCHQRGTKRRAVRTRRWCLCVALTRADTTAWAQHGDVLTASEGARSRDEQARARRGDEQARARRGDEQARARMEGSIGTVEVDNGGRSESQSGALVVVSEEDMARSAN